MKTTTILLTFLLVTNAWAQRSMQQDSTLNNLAHDEGYITDPTPSLGGHVKTGHGDKDMILIAGLGFGHGIFDDFIEANKDQYTMHAVTLAGFGATPAPPMPNIEEASYGKMSWTKIAMNDIIDLIKSEKMDKPILVGQFINGTQIAFEIGREHPELVGGVIILGGEPFRYFADQTDQTKAMPYNQRVMGVDKYFAPQWFKTVTRKTWDDNMFLPEHYAMNKEVAQDIWDESAEVPMPVMIRYLCEFFVYDVTLEIAKLQVPTMVLVPSFSDDLFNNENAGYLKTYFVDSWDYVKKANPKIQFETIQDARLFVWKDQPEKTYQVIRDFTKKLK